MNLQAMQMGLDRFAAWVLAVELIALIVFLFLLYAVTKAAVRDGIKDSGIVDAIRSLRTPIEEPKLPPMRADR